MAVEVNVLELQARTESLEKAIGTLGSLRTAGAQTETSFKDLALRIAGYSSVANLAVQSGQALLRGIKDLAVESVTLAAGFEKSRMTWGVLVGDMQRGSKVFDQLYQFAAKTPLSFQGVEHAAQTLKGMGVATEDLVGVMGRLGDVAMGDDAKLQRVSLVYGQVIAKGKADTRDLWQFVDAGVPIVNLLSETLGVTGGKVLEMTADGKIGFSQVEAAIKKATSEGGQFYNLMNQVAETASGKWSTAVDNWKNSLAEIGNVVLPALTAALDDFNKTITSLSLVGTMDKVLKGEIRDYETVTATFMAAQNVLNDPNHGNLGWLNFAKVKNGYEELRQIQSKLRAEEELRAKAAKGSFILGDAPKTLTPDQQAILDAQNALIKKFKEIDQSSV